MENLHTELRGSTPKKPSGQLSVMLGKEDWSRLITLKHKLETASGVVMSITEVVKWYLGVALPVGPEQPAPAPAPVAPRVDQDEGCSRCASAHAGDYARCDYCQRRLALDLVSTDMIDKGEAIVLRVKNMNDVPAQPDKKATRSTSRKKR